MKLIKGECLEVMKTLEDGVCDSLVTDPPAGISFMGKDWDSDKGGRTEWVIWMTSVMRECNRVMKPGAHGLVWALPRTSHWTATALEDAGFEIRDVVTHLFGQGFPKSLDISKAIDKAAGAEREIISKNPHARPNSDGKQCGYSGIQVHSEHITAPATDAAKAWQGWGTALKPASEHWILVRKPISEKTVASNTLKHGTGGINIDGSRISTGGEVVWKVPPSDKQAESVMVYDKPGAGSDSMFKNKGDRQGTPLGRFPANLVLSHTPYCTDDQCDIECAIKMLDEQSGTLTSGTRNGKRKDHDEFGTFCEKARDTGKSFDSSRGGASRFFYCAKISASERNAGLEELEAKPKKECYGTGLNTATKCDPVLHTPESVAARKGSFNNHPTVKPQKLMRYLIKLITPPGGTVLDPFMGSGSTGLAAAFEGFDFVGIERQQDYFEISEKRIFNTFPEFKKQTHAAGTGHPRNINKGE